MRFQQSYAPTAQVPQDPNIMAGALVRDFGKDVADIENSIYKRNMTTQAMEAEAARQAQEAEIERAKLLRQQQKDTVDKQYKEDTIRARGNELSHKQKVFETGLEREDDISEAFNKIIEDKGVDEAIQKGQWDKAINRGVAKGATLNVPADVTKVFLKMRQEMYGQNQAARRAGIMADTRVRTTGMRTSAKNQPKTVSEIINLGSEFGKQDEARINNTRRNKEEVKKAHRKADDLYDDAVMAVNEPAFKALLNKIQTEVTPETYEQIRVLNPTAKLKYVARWAIQNGVETEADLAE